MLAGWLCLIFELGDGGQLQTGGAGDHMQLTRWRPPCWGARKSNDVVCVHEPKPATARCAHCHCGLVQQGTSCIRSRLYLEY